MVRVGQPRIVHYFLCMAENKLLEQSDGEWNNKFLDWWKRFQRIKTIELSLIIGSQSFYFLSNYNPWVFYFINEYFTHSRVISI